jgi:hypothetical protein
MELEYMAVLESAKHAVWMIQLLQNLKLKLEPLISIYYDLKGACDITSNNVFHKKMKHINI